MGCAASTTRVADTVEDAVVGEVDATKKQAAQQLNQAATDATTAANQAATDATTAATDASKSAAAAANGAAMSAANTAQAAAADANKTVAGKAEQADAAASDEVAAMAANIAKQQAAAKAAKENAAKAAAQATDDATKAAKAASDATAAAAEDASKPFVMPDDGLDRSGVEQNVGGCVERHSADPEIWNIDGTEIDLGPVKYTLGGQLWYIRSRALERHAKGKPVMGVPMNQKAKDSGRAYDAGDDDDAKE